MRPIEMTLEDVHRLIHKTASHLHRKYGGDREEYLSDAYMAFVSAYNSHNLNRSNFTTWLVNYIRYDNAAKRRRGAVKNRLMPTYLTGEYDETLPAPKKRVVSSRSWLRSLLKELSEDAQTVVTLIVSDTPPDIQWDLETRESWEPESWRKALRTFLKDIGWTHLRIKTAFRDIESYFLRKEMERFDHE